MVLVLLAIGMMAETLRLPHGSLTSRAEQLKLSDLQLASSTAREKVRIQRADQGIPANSNDNGTGTGRVGDALLERPSKPSHADEQLPVLVFDCAASMHDARVVNDGDIAVLPVDFDRACLSDIPKLFDLVR